MAWSEERRKEHSERMKQRWRDKKVTDAEKPKKKGKPSWRPQRGLVLTGVPDGYRPRWVLNDQLNIERKLDQGWEFISRAKGDKAEHSPQEWVGDGKPLDSMRRYREFVAMALPEELGQARDEYHQEQNRQQVRGIKRDLQKDMDEATDQADPRKMARAEGKIIIE